MKNGLLEIDESTELRKVVEKIRNVKIVISNLSQYNFQNRYGFPRYDLKCPSVSALSFSRRLSLFHSGVDVIFTVESRPQPVIL